MSSLIGLLNRLLPFATPGTPLVQDVAHLAIICIGLYFASQIQEWLRERSAIASTPQHDDGPQENAIFQGDDHVENDDIELATDGQDAIRGERPSDAANAGDAAHVNPGAPGPGLDLNVGEGQPGHARNVPQQRNIGAKKAKALARRDQRRAYNEFVRSQGDVQRAQDAQGAAEREAATLAEKDRRAAVEAAIEAKKAKEREQRRVREETARREEFRRRDYAIDVVRRQLETQKACNLSKVAREIGDDADEKWLEGVLRARGVVGSKGDVLTLVTGRGWVVRVTAEDMARVYRAASDAGLGDDAGRITFDDLGDLLHELLTQEPP